MGDDNSNDFRLKRDEDTPDEEGRVERIIKQSKKIKAYQPPGFEKYSVDADQSYGETMSAKTVNNLCCCDSVCACDSVGTDSCACYEVCTCHNVCTCDSVCQCDGHSGGGGGGGTYYYYVTYYTYYWY